MDIHRAGHTITKQDVLAVTTILRVVCMSISAYEYVASCVSPPFIITHIRSAISSLSRGSIACIRPPMEGGKKVNANLER
jgi:hypothetical protein